MTDQPKRSVHDQISQAMPDQPELALAITESIHEKIASSSTLWELGFHEDAMGQQILPNAKVIFYDCFGAWEIDIMAPKGAIGFTVPMGGIGVKFDDEDRSHRRLVAGLRYLLRDHSRDELLKLMDEAEAERDYDIDGWKHDQGRPDDWPDSEADKDRPQAR
jgi:hypothetical protein